MLSPNAHPTVVDLAEYRAKRLAARPAAQASNRYVLWYPGIGYLRPGGANTSPVLVLAEARPVGSHRDRR